MLPRWSVNLAEFPVCMSAHYKYVMIE